MTRMNYWNEFYKQHENLEPSSFFHAVEERLKSSNLLVIDLGCGTGRDSFAFARRGYRVYGIDGSVAAIQKNKELASNAPYHYRPIFREVDVSVEHSVRELFQEIESIRQAENLDLLIYARFFFHAIPEEVETQLVQSIDKSFAGPYDIALEFRTEEDEKNEKVHGDHYRRYINTQDFLKRMIQQNFSIKEFYKGTGLSIYKEEDPYLARVWMKNI